MAKKEVEIKEELPNEEVSEEVVQATAMGIVEQAEEENKSVEEVVNEIVEEAKEEGFEPKKEYHGDLRGFKTLEEAVNYPNTEAFKKLDIGCQKEYSNWLKENIL